MIATVNPDGGQAVDNPVTGAARVEYDALFTAYQQATTTLSVKRSLSNKALAEYRAAQRQLESAKQNLLNYSIGAFH
jgi:hypothetical protein